MNTKRLFGYFSLLTFIFLPQFIFAQIENSIHFLHKELYGKNVQIENGLFKNVEILPLDRTVKKSLNKSVFGYLPDWEYANNSHQYFKYDLLTHIACFDFFVSKTGGITDPAGWPWTDLINKAHANGVKVILTAVKFGSSSSEAADLHYLMTDQAAKDNFYNNTISKMKAYKLDGVNVDFEALNSADRGVVVVQFMKELSERVKAELPEAEVSFAGPVINWGSWDLTGLTNVCDYIFIMGYAFYGSWSDNTGPGSPLLGGSNNITTSLTSSTNYGTAVANMPEKIILGIPYYGLQWKTTSEVAHATTTSFVSSPRYYTAESTAQLNGVIWDATSKTPWTRWNDGSWNQIWYDNDSSLGLKYDLAISKNLKGVGMWALGYDGARQELWNLIDQKFGSGQLPVPVTPQNFNVAGADDQSVFINFKIPDWAQGYEIYKSADADTYKLEGLRFDNNVTVNDLSFDSAYYFKIAAFNTTGSSTTSEVLAATPNSTQNKVLIVNGFDRISGTSNTLDFIKKYVNPVIWNNYRFNSASNEAVYSDFVNLTDYEIVIWILGDESTADETFNSFEQEKVKEFLQQGGKLLVSGAEIGWDLSAKGGTNDKLFYKDYLKAVYIDDAPNGASATYYSAEGITGSVFDGIAKFNFDNGSHGTFDVDWPDAIRADNGAENILKFSGFNGSGFAGISYEGVFGEGTIPGKVVHLSIPFETIYPEEVRVELMNKIFAFFERPVSVDESNPSLINDFALIGNYPNPFNPSTKILFTAPGVSAYSFKVYDMLGQMVSSVNGYTRAGSNELIWNAENSTGEKLVSGMYIYTISFDGISRNQKQFSGKMMLVK